MQREPKKQLPHPAEAIASAVFVSCCRTLGALRSPYRISSEPSSINPGLEYQKSWQEYLQSEHPFLQEWLEHPVDFVEWGELLGRMNRLTFNHRHYKDLAYKQKVELHHAAMHHPNDILSICIRHTTEIVDILKKPRSETPGDAAKPFTLEKVIGWLSEMDLITNERDTVEAKSMCFDGAPKVRFTGLSLDTIHKIGDWVTGPLAPPARLLDFHLLDGAGKPTMAREVLYIQGLCAPNETHLALLHVLPTWSEAQRTTLMDMILASWIRSVEVYCDSSTFKSECAAGQVHRWQNILRYLPNIPTVQTRSKGSSAGFTQL